MNISNKNLVSLEGFKGIIDGKHGEIESGELRAGTKEFKIGTMLKEIRAEMGMTQEQIAEYAGLSISYLSAIENNKREPGISTLQKIIEFGFGLRMN